MHLFMLLDEFAQLFFVFFSLSVELLLVFIKLSEQYLVLAFDASQFDLHLFFKFVLFEAVRLPLVFLLSYGLSQLLVVFLQIFVGLT